MALSPAHTLRCLALLALILVMPMACNSRQTVLDTPFSPSGQQAPEIPFATSTVFGLTFNPVAVLGTGSSRGTVVLSLPAPPGGLPVALSSTDPALSVPASITVPAGADAAEFVATSEPVPSDREVTVAASYQDRAVRGALRLWALLPTFFSFTSEQGDQTVGGFRRLTPENATFTAFCNQHVIDIGISGAESWRARFAGPAGAPMQTGSYVTGKFSQGLDPNPWFDVSGPGRSCGFGSAGSGRFTVREVDVTAAGDVRRFWATFTQQCGGQAPIQGDMRVSNVAPPASQAQRCLTTTPSPTSGSSPTFIYYQTIPEGTAERLEPNSSIRLTGYVTEGYNAIQLFASPPPRSVSPFMSIGMRAGRNQRLVPGVYRVSAADFFGTQLNVSGPRSCGSGSNGEFEVFEAVYGGNAVGTLGIIERFRARFNLRCVENPALGIRGELAVFNLPNR